MVAHGLVQSLVQSLVQLAALTVSGSVTGHRSACGLAKTCPTTPISRCQQVSQRSAYGRAGFDPEVETALAVPWQCGASPRRTALPGCPGAKMGSPGDRLPCDRAPVVSAMNPTGQPEAPTGKVPPRKPPLMADEQLGLNARLGAFVTSKVGSMWSVYITIVFVFGWIVLATTGPLHKSDPYPFPFLLFLGNLVQLLLVFVILVGNGFWAEAPTGAPSGRSKMPRRSFGRSPRCTRTSKNRTES